MSTCFLLLSRCVQKAESLENEGFLHKKKSRHPVSQIQNVDFSYMVEISGIEPLTS